MIDRHFRLMRWWIQRFYGIARYLGRRTGQEEHVERAIDVTEDNFERILEGDDK